VQTRTPLPRLDLSGRALLSGDAHAEDAVDNSPNGEYYVDIRNNTKAALNWLRTNVPLPDKYSSVVARLGRGPASPAGFVDL
jgi:hypothetical protein